MGPKTSAQIEAECPVLPQLPAQGTTKKSRQRIHFQGKTSKKPPWRFHQNNKLIFRTKTKVLLFF